MNPHHSPSPGGRAPNPFAPAASTPLWSGGGLPEDRLARVAARRAFVELKCCFMAAVAEIDDDLGDFLRRKVRATSDPIQLWNLRSVVLAALPRHHPRTGWHRDELLRQLQLAFPDSGVDTTFVPL